MQNGLRTACTRTKWSPPRVWRSAKLKAVPDRQRARKAVVITIALLVAGAHLFTGPGYRGPLRPFVTGYLIDILLPLSSYFLLVMASDTLPALHRWQVKVVIVFLVMSSAEVAQYFGKPVFGRTYDPLDFLAYAAGALLAALLDRVLLPRVLPMWRGPQ